jgi:hypothetical protein
VCVCVCVRVCGRCRYLSQISQIVAKEPLKRINSNISTSMDQLVHKVRRWVSYSTTAQLHNCTTAQLHNCPHRHCLWVCACALECACVRACVCRGVCCVRVVSRVVSRASATVLARLRLARDSDERRSRLRPRPRSRLCVCLLFGPQS